jgi:hypothetical protein
MATPILDVIIADVNALIPNLASLASTYRLLVGSAEEIGRIPGVPLETYERAITRFDRCGTLIDIIQELLCCKIKFLAEYLSTTCAPIDVFSLAQNPLEASTIEEIIEVEVLRRILKCCCEEKSCFSPPAPLNSACAFPCPNPIPNPTDLTDTE